MGRSGHIPVSPADWIYSVRLAPHSVVYEEWEEVQRIIKATGSRSFGNYKKFTLQRGGADLRDQAEAWAESDPVQGRRKCTFLHKMMVTNLLGIVVLYFAHWAITELYHIRCQHYLGSPECKFLYTVQGAVVTAYENIYLAMTTLVATGCLSIATNLLYTHCPNKVRRTYR